MSVLKNKYIISIICNYVGNVDYCNNCKTICAIKILDRKWNMMICKQCETRQLINFSELKCCRRCKNQCLGEYCHYHQMISLYTRLRQAIKMLLYTKFDDLFDEMKEYKNKQLITIEKYNMYKQQSYGHWIFQISSPVIFIFPDEQTQANAQLELDEAFNNKQMIQCKLNDFCKHRYKFEDMSIKKHQLRYFNRQFNRSLGQLIYSPR